MNEMSDFEIRANNIFTGIQNVRTRVENFGYSDDNASNSVSRIMAMFITYLTSCEESRQNMLGRTGGFSTTVLANLPATDNPNWPSYIEPAPSSTLKDRAEALWGIRIAFTHGDGDITQISNRTNRQFAQNATNIIPGVTLNGSRLEISENAAHYAIRTLSQIHDLLT